MRVLLVEDDAKITAFVMKGFQQAGFAVDHAANGVAGLELALAVPYDAAVIDLMLPRLDGLALIEEVRRRKITTPVIILSAKRSVDDRVKGLHTGSDDYLTKPFALAELLARVQALIRRASGATEPTRLSGGQSPGPKHGSRSGPKARTRSWKWRPRSCPTGRSCRWA